MKELLAAGLDVFGDRPAALANDLTKKFESVQRGTLSQLAALLEGQGALRGEYILLIAGASTKTVSSIILPEEVD